MRSLRGPTIVLSVFGVFSALSMFLLLGGWRRRIRAN